MSSANIPNSGSISDFITNPNSSGDLRTTDTEPATQLGVSESIKNLLDPTRGRPGTAASLTADTGTTNFDTTEPANSPADGAHVVSAINSLLRGEISAAETYRNALEKIADGDHAQHAGLLREIQQQHGKASQSLRDRIRELGGQPADSSGAWGSWAQIVQGTLSLFGGDKGAVKALKEGEEHGLHDYENTISKLDPTTAQLIQNQLIPEQQRHIALLDQLISAV